MVRDFVLTVTFSDCFTARAQKRLFLRFGDISHTRIRFLDPDFLRVRNFGDLGMFSVTVLVLYTGSSTNIIFSASNRSLFSVCFTSSLESTSSFSSSNLYQFPRFQITCSNDWHFVFYPLITFIIHHSLAVSLQA